MIHMKETLTIYTEHLHKICVWCCVESLYIRCHVMSNTFPKKKSSRFVRIYKIGKRNLSLKTISVKKYSRFVGV